MRKLLIVFVAICCCLATRLGAQPKNAFQLPDFNFPVEVNSRAREALDSALQVGDDKLVVEALAQISVAQALVSQYKSNATIALFDSVLSLHRLAPDYQALLYYLEGRFVADMPNGYDDKNNEIRYWTYNKQKELTLKMYRQSLDPLGNGDVSALLRPIEQYEGLLTLGDSYGRRCLPMLYDFLCDQLNRTSLPADFKPYLMTWKKLHAKDKDIMPLAYIELRNGSLFNNGNRLNYVYKHFGRREELGMFISTTSNASRWVEEDYVKRYPHTRFSGQIQASLANKDKQAVHIYYPRLLLSTDSIKLDNVFGTQHYELLLYRVPERLWPQLASQDAASIQVADFVLVDSMECWPKKMKDGCKPSFRPQPCGRYVILPRFLTPDGPYQEPEFEAKKIVSQLLYISDLRTFDVTCSQSRKVFVVNGQTGSPVEGVEVAYRYKKEGEMVCEKQVTDASGAVSLPHNGHLEYTLAKGEDRARYSYTANIYFEREISQQSVDFFTDLALYRPGETVQWSAVVHEQKEKTRNVIPNLELVVKLMNTEGKVQDSLRVTSDDYGQVKGKFILPDDERNGNFRLVAFTPDSASSKAVTLGIHYLQVSEYKLPNYYIDLSETPQHQHKFGFIKAKGRVMSYSGMPVANQPVKLTVNYHKEYNVSTNAEGRFSKRSWTKAGLQWRYLSSSLCWAGYGSVSAECETEDGEHVSASTSVTRGGRPSVSIATTQAYLLEPNKLLTLPITFYSPDPEVKELQCHYTLTNSKGKQVQRGSFSTSAPSFSWSDLPSGKYTMKCRVRGRGQGFKQQFALVRQGDKQLPVTLPLWAPQSLSRVTNEGKAQISFGTSYDSDVYYVASQQGGELASGWFKAHSGMNTIELQVPVSDDKLLYVNLYVCRDGEIHTGSLTLTLPERNAVTLRTVSFRDKITPGEKEHWSFTLLDAEGKPVEGRMMLELYSKAVENLSSNGWHIYSPRIQSRPLASYSFYKRQNYSSYFYIKPVAYVPYWVHYPALSMWGMSYARAFNGQPHNKPRKSVNGLVLDEEGDGIIGASVVETGTQNGTVTDVDGYFSLDLLTAGNSLTVKYIGYEDATVLSAPDLVVRLKEDELALEDVVVVGYGAKTRYRLSGNDKIYGARAASNEEISFALQSQAAGVQVQKNLRVRGATSVKIATTETDGLADMNASASESESADFNQITTRLGDVKVALWAPSLQPDSLGNFNLDFDVVNENTTWQLQALAYTSQLANDLFSTQVLAQRPLMVQPALPRFMRAGDTTLLKANVENATDTLLQVTVQIELFNPRTSQIYRTETFHLSMKAKSREVLSLSCQAPYDVTFLGIRIKAVNTRGDSDGEQQQIPILPATSEVVHTQPFYLPATQPSIEVQVPVAEIDSTSRLTLEYCDNPAWYCLETLPDIADHDHVTSTGLAHSLYAIVVADKLREQVLADSVAIGLLGSNEEAQSYTTLIAKLNAMQNADGGFPWLDDGRFSPSSSWATKSVIECMGNLVQLHYLPADSTLHQLIVKALQYMDRQICEQVEKNAAALPSDYVYIRKLFGDDYGFASDSLANRCQSIIAQTVVALKGSWKLQNLDERAFSAMTLARSGYTKEALSILESLNQLAVHDSRRGMYWEHLNQTSFYHPVACTALMLEAFAEVAPQQYAASIEEMRQWLLLEKQTSKWSSYSMASQAVHSLLLSGQKWEITHHNTSGLKIRIDGKPVDFSMSDSQKGLLSLNVPANAQAVEITHSGNTPSWGALSHRHIVPIEQIKADSMPEIAIRKELYIEVKDEKSDSYHWVEIADTTDLQLKVGDKIQVRLVVGCRKDFDCLVLTDERPACLEPQDYLSGYRWNWRTAGYYQEVKDTCMKFYLGRLREGVHTFTYNCHITNAGTFSAGMAKIESEIAPQFTAHSEGKTIDVESF